MAQPPQQRMDDNNQPDMQRRIRRHPRRNRSKSQDRIIAITRMNYTQYINFQLRQGIPRHVAEQSSQYYAQREGRLRQDLVKRVLSSSNCKLGKI